MSGVLSDADREALHAPHAVPINPTWPGCPICHDYAEALAAITTRAVNAALTEAADAIKAVPAMYGSDNYLQALTRAECIVRARVRGESA